MEITENIANMLKTFKKEHNLSLIEMANELEISSSTLQDYLAGQGNPNVKTIEHIASKMNISPRLLVNDVFSNDLIEKMIPLYEELSLVKQLPEHKRKRFVYLFAELLALWDDEEQTKQ